MNRILRALARFLDYIWFYGFLLLVFDLFDVSYLFYLVSFIALPILFIPVEIILLKLFRTTLGKALFGFSYNKDFSWKTAAAVAGQKGFLLQPLFTPLVNLIYAVFYIKELKRYPENRWDEYKGIRIAPQKSSFFSKTLLIALAAIVTTFVTFPDPTIGRISSMVGIEVPAIIRKNNSKNFEKWAKISEKSFSIFFPKKPKFFEKDYPIPGSSTKLHVKEYHHEADLHFSLTYTTLPSSWTIWGSSRVLKTALSQMEKRIGRIQTKSMMKHDSYPAMYYVLKNGKKATIGKLILVKNTLYRVEATSSKDLDTNSHEIAMQFIDSLELQ